MGRSSGACFKMIACGGDSVDREDLQAHQEKISNDRRGWSFRKRSPGHRVLSNVVISETASSVIKDCPESTHISVQPQSDLPVAERKTVIQWKEESIELPAPPYSNLTDTKAASEEDPEDDEILDESSIIAIQAAVRKFLAQRMLAKKRSIIKLQAVVRGYLVRKRAMGTLRCVQAIVKMQALVRARHTRLLLEGSGDSEKQSQIKRNKREAKLDGKSTYVSIEKLLSNRFAQQLMESSPKSKSINIKCDSSKSSDSWKWLERWMSASSMNDAQALESGSATEKHEKENLEQFDSKGGIIVPSDISLYSENLKSGAEHHEKENPGYSDCKGHILVPSDSFPHLVNLKSGAELHDNKNLEDSECKGRVLIPSDSSPDSTNFKSSAGASAEESANNDYLISRNGGNLDLVSESISPSSSHPELQNVDKPSDLSCDVTEFIPSKVKEADSNLQLEEQNLPDKNETVSEREIHNIQKFSSELMETEPKKFSRKASNPAFIAAQSKFEELSSAPLTAKVNISSSQDPEVVECSLGTGLFTSDKPFRTQNIGQSENSVPSSSAVQNCCSECETEISISSTLDSPERFGDHDIEQEPISVNATVDSPSRENSTLVTQGTPDIMGIDPSHANNENLLERNESNEPAAGEFDNSVLPVDLPPLEKKLEADPSLHHLKQGSESSNLVPKSSPDSSPRSHITNTEFQTTPSSQALKRKTSRDEKSGTSHKNRSSSAGKKSLLNPNQDSTPRSSVEQLPKDHKAGKRRNSLGSSKSDHADLEPKDSSSTSLPSYMQATESARAKAIASVSPRSSPDVQDLVLMKKKHSLPATNGREGSPLIQPSLSLAQQNAKGNGIHSPQERKWRR